MFMYDFASTSKYGFHIYKAFSETVVLKLNAEYSRKLLGAVLWGLVIPEIIMDSV